jgi:hypothetical protein
VTRWRGSVAAWGISLAFLFSRTWAIYRPHLRMVLAVAGGVVAVVDLILGLGLGQLTARYRTNSPPGGQAATFAAMALVTTPLITAMLARAVLDIVAGDQPSVRRSIRCGLDLFAPLLLAMVLWIGAVVAGVFALILPGLYILVSWYFVAQAVVVDDRRGLAALLRSGELVRGRWLGAALTGLAIQLAVLVPSSIAALVFDAAARQADAQAILVVGDIVVQTFTVPFVAIAATLFYLDLRAQVKPATPRAAL